VKITTVFVLALALVAGGCGCSEDVKKKIATETAVHDGYVRVIKKGVKKEDGAVREVTREELIRMVLLSRKGWHGVSHYCLDTPAPDETYDKLETVKIGGE
jgi:hypothetical protein